MNVTDQFEKERASSHMPMLTMPVMTPEAFANSIGLPLSILQAQCKRGYWPTIKVGKRVFVNVEAVRLQVGRQFLEAYSTDGFSMQMGKL